MKKLPIATAVALSTFAMSSHAVYLQKSYSTVATSGALTTTALVPTNTYYTNPTPGGASVSTAPAITLVRSGDWTFDFTNLNAVTFTGAVEYGNYETQTNVSSVNIQGHIVYTGVKQSFSGVGVYNDVNNVFTFTKAAGAANSGVGSVYSATAAATCKSVGAALGSNVCSSWAATTPAWESLSLFFVFDENRNNFSGGISGKEIGGSGVTAATTAINWSVVGEVPVPAGAWLFGSALVGLAGVKRRKAKA